MDRLSHVRHFIYLLTVWKFTDHAYSGTVISDILHIKADIYGYDIDISLYEYPLIANAVEGLHY